MSIIIKGVKKPNNGYTMGILLYPNGDAFILSNEIPVKICKAIELPPHGDLIDRDAFLVEHQDDYTDYIRDAPVIIPREERTECLD